VIVQLGPKPVIAVPGLTPTSPVTADVLVQVTVEAPRTAKPDAEPKEGESSPASVDASEAAADSLDASASVAASEAGRAVDAFDASVSVAASVAGPAVDGLDASVSVVDPFEPGEPMGGSALG
jgi:hypothetical protein